MDTLIIHCQYKIIYVSDHFLAQDLQFCIMSKVFFQYIPMYSWGTEKRYTHAGGLVPLMFFAFEAKIHLV